MEVCNKTHTVILQNCCFALEDSAVSSLLFFQAPDTLAAFVLIRLLKIPMPSDYFLYSKSNS